MMRFFKNVLLFVNLSKTGICHLLAALCKIWAIGKFSVMLKWSTLVSWEMHKLRTGDPWLMRISIVQFYRTFQRYSAFICFWCNPSSLWFYQNNLAFFGPRHPSPRLIGFNFANLTCQLVEIGNIRLILLPVYNHVIKIEATRKYYRLLICNILSHFFNGLRILILPDYPGCFISLRDCLFCSLEYTNPTPWLMQVRVTNMTFQKDSHS